jgi:copper chaperone CopZ
MLATLVLSLFISATASSEGSFQGATVEITDLGSCTGCVGGITRAMKRIDGVVDVVLEEEGTIRVTAEDGIWIDPDDLRNIVRNAGYTAGTVASVCRGTLAKKEEQAFFAAASAADEASLPVEDPEGLISEGPHRTGPLRVHRLVADPRSPGDRRLGVARSLSVTDAESYPRPCLGHPLLARGPRVDRDG